MDDLIDRQATMKYIEKMRQDALLIEDIEDIREASRVMTSMDLLEKAVRNQPSAGIAEQNGWIKENDKMARTTSKTVQLPRFAMENRTNKCDIERVGRERKAILFTAVFGAMLWAILLLSIFASKKLFVVLISAGFCYGMWVLLSKFFNYMRVK